MTLTLDLSPEEEARLQQRANAAGLPPADYLRKLIGDYDPQLDPNYSDDWTDEDMRDFTAASMQRFSEQVGEEDEAFNA
jgi:hypothetical protein